MSYENTDAKHFYKEKLLFIIRKGELLLEVSMYDIIQREKFSLKHYNKRRIV